LNARQRQFVAERQAAIKQLHDEWYQAAKAFKASEATHDPRNIQVDLLLECYHKANGYFDCLETCIAQGGLLGAREDEYWAADMEGTALNVLSKLPEFYAWLWSLIEPLDLAPNSFQPGPGAFSNMQGLLAVRRPEKASPLRKTFSEAKLPTNGFDHPPIPMTATWEKVSLFVAGTAILVIMLLIALFDRHPTDLAIWIYRAVLSMAAAGFGAIVPGFFRIETRWVKATGAIGLAVMVYLFNPPALVKQHNEAADKAKAEAVQPGAK
jgi:hypothetical protein